MDVLQNPLDIYNPSWDEVAAMDVVNLRANDLSGWLGLVGGASTSGVQAEYGWLHGKLIRPITIRPTRHHPHSMPCERTDAYRYSNLISLRFLFTFYYLRRFLWIMHLMHKTNMLVLTN